MLNSEMTEEPMIQIPFPQNPDFVGQESILKELKLFVRNEARPCMVSLYGLGGIGYESFQTILRQRLKPSRKSQVALRLAYWAKEMLPETSILWVFASTRERFEQDYIAIAKGLRLPGHKDPETDYLSLVKRSLEEPESGKWLMIIDNADDLSLFHDNFKDVFDRNNNKRISDGILKYVPEGRNGVVVFTTRNKVDALHLTREGKTIHVTEMKDEDLTSILRSKIGSEIPQDNNWIDLIRTLHRVPLAIVQAASFIRQNSWPVSKYLKYFGQEDEELSMKFLLHDFQDKTRDKTVDNSLFKTWMITVRQLETQQPRAADVLWMMAFFNNQNIPRYLLISHSPSQESSRELTDNQNNLDLDLGKEKPGKESQIMSEYYLDEAIGVLKAYSFINVISYEQGEGYTLHRLVQIFSRYWLKEHKHTFQTWESRMLSSLLREFPKREYEDWTKSAQLLPHVQGFVDSPYGSKLPPGDLGVLLSLASTYLRMKGQFSLAEQYVGLAIKILTTGLGEDDEATLEAKGCLALIWRDTDQLGEAETMLRSIIEKSIKLAGRDDSKTIQVMMNLGSVLRHQKKYSEAVSLGRECVSAFEKIKGPESTRTLESKMSLAASLGSDGQHEAALRLQRQVAEVFKQRYGEDHPRRLGLQHDLSVTLNLVGKFVEALALPKHVFRLTLDIYGPEHPRTVNIEFNLALSLESNHLHEQAETHFRRVVEYRLQNHVGDNLNTIQYLRCLALCLGNQEQYTNAHYYLNMAWEKARAEPDINDMKLIIQNNIANLQYQEEFKGKNQTRIFTAIPTSAAAMYAGAVAVYTGSASCVIS
jgi:tetratricopeptide (TPR) repeat protein